MRVLVIEDDPKAAVTLMQGLSERGMQVDTAHDAAQGERLAEGGSHDVVVLDVMLPDEDGVSLCRRLRGRGIRTPVLMLTALGETGSKVRGLEAGADDYLTKPFEFDELVARLRALARRGGPAGEAVLRYRELELDRLTRVARRGERDLRLTPTEFQLLEFFLEQPERVLSRAEIGKRVWKVEFERGGNVIEVYVSSLRRKMEKKGEARLIHTAVGFGYILAAEAPASARGGRS